MANNGSGDVDYFELRRRHQEYKKNATRKPEEAETLSPSSPRAEDAPYMRPAPAAEDVREQDFPEDEISGKGASVPYAGDEDDGPDQDEADNSGANPFQSFIQAFNKIRSKFAARRAENTDGGLDDSDDGYDDEEPKEERRGPFRFLRKHGEEPEDESEPDEPLEEEDAPADDESFARDAHSPEDAPPTGDVADLEDVPDQAFVPDVLDVPEEETFPEGEAIPVPRAKDEAPFAEGDEDDAPRGGGLKRFLNLFVVREDRAEGEPIDEDDYEVEEPENRAILAGKTKDQKYDDSLFTKPREHGAREEEQEPMGEQENNKADLTDFMADGLDDGTLSRRERRLLKERQEALKQAAEPEAPEGANIDEPTREYKPVPRPQSQPEARPEHISSLFGDDEGTRRKPAKRDDYDDEDDDEPKSRRRAKRDDYDDEDDEPKSRRRAKRDDYDDEDDDEPKSRRRAKRDDYDDEDDDEPKSRRRAKRDDYDEDDDYEARRGYDAYADDDDGDDDAPSFAHYVLGFFKVLIAVVLVLAVALFGLYFADQAVPGGVGAYEWLQEKLPVIDKILPPGADDADSGDADNALDLTTTSPDESPAPDATDAGTVG